MSVSDENLGGEPDHGLGGLSERQRACLELVSEGRTSKEIARELDLSPRTVDHHISACIRTLGVPNRVAAVSRLEELKRETEHESGPALPEATPPGFMFGRTTIAVDPPIIRPLREPTVKRMLPPLGGRPNIASRSDRIGWMVRIFILAMMAAAALTLSIMAIFALSAGLK